MSEKRTRSAGAPPRAAPGDADADARPSARAQTSTTRAKAASDPAFK